MSKKLSSWPLIAPKKVDTSITGEQVLDVLAADVEAADNGKVLTAAYGGLEGEETGSVMWARVDRLPAIQPGDAGKVLTVNSGETGTEWAAPAGGGVAILYGGGATGSVVLSATPNDYSKVKVEFDTSNYIGKEILAVFAPLKMGFSQSYMSDITVTCGSIPAGATSGDYYPEKKVITSSTHSFYIGAYNSGDTARSLTFSPVCMLIKL